MTRLYANNYSTTLNGAIASGDTTITVDSVADLPAIGGGDVCLLTIQEGSKIEIVEATAVSGSDITVTRAQQGTTAQAFADESIVENRATSDDFDRIAQDGTDNSLARYDAANNRLQDSNVTVSDADYMTGLTGLDVDNITIDGNTLSSTDTNGNIILDANGTGTVNIQDNLVLSDDILISNGNGVYDENSNEQLLFNTTASAVNYLDITNAATGSGPTFSSKGDDTDVDLNLAAQGAGKVTLQDNLDTNQNWTEVHDTYGIRDENENEQLTFTTTASAINYINLTNAATGNSPTFAAAGDDANIGVNFSTKGDGNYEFSTSNVGQINFGTTPVTFTSSRTVFGFVGNSSQNVPVAFINEDTSGSVFFFAGEDPTSGSTPYFMERFGSTHGTRPGEVRISNQGAMEIRTTADDITFNPTGTVISDSGISFDSGSNILSDYEEGTFTPTVTFETPGDLSVTYNSRSGLYTIIGNVAFLRVFLDITLTYTTASGDFRISSLPVTPVPQGNAGLVAYHSSNFPYATGASIMQPITNAGGFMDIRGFGSGLESGGSSTTLTASDFTSGNTYTFITNVYFYI